MKVIFCSMMFSDVEENIKKSKRPHPVSGHKFQENFVKGFEANNCDLTVVNIPRVRCYPDYPKILFKRVNHVWGKNVPGTDIGYLNLFGLNQITQCFGAYRELRRQLKNGEDEPTVLVTFNSYLNTSLAMMLAKRAYPNVKTCSIIGDLHGSYGVVNTTKGLKGALIRKMESIQDSIGKKFDSYVFLTKYMAEALDAEDKPYAVVEGTYTVDTFQTEQKQDADSQEKIVFYAGALCKEYGIEHLLKAFSMIEYSNYRLIIAGGGDAVKLVQQYAAEDERITFLGFISPSEVLENQQQATVLVNPRMSDLKFVKYSFPSKIMEYLASGTPNVGHRLPCIPSEYEGYIQYAADESDEALRDKIVEVCELSKQERDEIGRRARQFIYEQKNPKVMCRRVLDMWTQIF